MMDIKGKLGHPTSVRITDTIAESPTVTTLVFRKRPWMQKYHPGQFLMIWIPGVDEIPMSVSLWASSRVGITVQPVGDATEALSALKKNDWVGIRGPFGRGFVPDSENALIVGGGIGLAPLRPLTYVLLERGSRVTLLTAARTKDQLLYIDEFKTHKAPEFRLLTATDDGSEGNRGLATEVVEEHLKNEAYDTLYACGPEPMLSGLFEMASERGMRFQASLERFMKCGCGICGTCAMDPTGALVCQDGPVFSEEQIAKLDEFGKYCRDATGARTKF